MSSKKDFFSVNLFKVLSLVPVLMSDLLTSEATKVGQFKRWTYKRRTGTNVGLV